MILANSESKVLFFFFLDMIIQHIDRDDEGVLYCRVPNIIKGVQCVLIISLEHCRDFLFGDNSLLDV